MGPSELNAKRAFLNLLATTNREEGNHIRANALHDIAEDLLIYENMPRITFEGDSKTAKCGGGSEDIFQVDDHHECVQVVCYFEDKTPAWAGIKFSKWLQKLAAKGDKT